MAVVCACVCVRLSVKYVTLPGVAAGFLAGSLVVALRLCALGVLCALHVGGADSASGDLPWCSGVLGVSAMLRLLCAVLACASRAAPRTKRSQPLFENFFFLLF